MIRILLSVAGVAISFNAIGAYAQSSSAAPAADRLTCSTLGLAFQNSAAISNQNVETLRSRGADGSFLESMKANAQKLTDTGMALERRHGKADTPAQIAEAAAMAQKPLKPMKDMAAVCLK